MQALSRTLLVMMALAAIGLAGCGGDQEPTESATGEAAPTEQMEGAAETADDTEPTEEAEQAADEPEAAATGYTQDTPLGTLQKAFSAIERGDKAAFMECVQANDENAEFLAATFKVGTAGMKLSRAIEEAYGEAGLEAFHAAAGGQQGPAMTEVEDLDDSEVKIDGDTATVMPPDAQEPVEMVRADGKWYLAAMGEMPQGQQREMALKMVDAMGQAMGEVTAQAGAEGQTPESLAQALQEKMQMVVMQMMQEAMQQQGGGQGGGMPPMPAPNE